MQHCSMELDGHTVMSLMHRLNLPGKRFVYTLVINTDQLTFE
jgi:hypothetical protein